MFTGGGGGYTSATSAPSTRSRVGRFLLFYFFEQNRGHFLLTYSISLLLLDVLAEPVEALLEATLLEDRAHLQM